METKTARSNSREGEKYVVRLPDGMRARVAARGKKDGRSMNAVFVLSAQQHLDGMDELDNMLHAVALLKQELLDKLAALEGVDHD